MKIRYRFLVSMRVGDHWEDYAQTNDYPNALECVERLARCFPGRPVVLRDREIARSRLAA